MNIGFVRTTGMVLIATAIAKVWSVFGQSRVLVMVDPIAGISFRWLLVAVGMLELLVAGVCLFGKNMRVAMLLVAWLATNFAVYRAGLWWMGWLRPCHCMGALAGAMHLSDQAADNIMRAVLLYLLIGSYGLLLWQGWQRRDGDMAGAFQPTPGSPASE